MFNRTSLFRGYQLVGGLSVSKFDSKTNFLKYSANQSYTLAQ